MKPIPCMGGWCARREFCKHYRSPVRLVNPPQRLCVPGRDGVLRSAIDPVKQAEKESA